MGGGNGDAGWQVAQARNGERLSLAEERIALRLHPDDPMDCADELYGTPHQGIATEGAPSDVPQNEARQFLLAYETPPPGREQPQAALVLDPTTAHASVLAQDPMLPVQIEEGSRCSNTSPEAQQSMEVSTKPALGDPMPLIQWDEETQSFQPCPEALQFLRTIRCHVAVVAICGAARTGKSFLLNRILQLAAAATAGARSDVSSISIDVTRGAPPTDNCVDPDNSTISSSMTTTSSSTYAPRPMGFKVSPSVEPCTRGLWLCASPTPFTAYDGTQWRLILVDTEGVDATDSDENTMARVLALALSLSSVALLNQRGALTSSALTRLLLATQVAHILQGEQHGSAPTSLATAQDPLPGVLGSAQEPGSGFQGNHQGPVSQGSSADLSAGSGVPACAGTNPGAGVRASGIPGDNRTPGASATQSMGEESKAGGAPQAQQNGLAHAYGAHAEEAAAGAKVEHPGHTSEGPEAAEAPPGVPAPRFPALFWVLRDFALSLRQGETPAAYLEGVLDQAPEAVGGPLREAFPQRDCFALPRPAQGEDLLQNLENAPFSELVEEFQNGVRLLAEEVIKTAAAAGASEGAPCGASLVDTVQELVRAVNGAPLPNVQSSARALAQRVYQQALDEALAQYSVMTSARSPGDRRALRDQHEAEAWKAMRLFAERVRGVGRGSGDFRRRLQERMEEQFETRDFKLQEEESLEEARRVRARQEEASRGSWCQRTLESVSRSYHCYGRGFASSSYHAMSELFCPLEEEPREISSEADWQHLQ